MGGGTEADLRPTGRHRSIRRHVAVLGIVAALAFAGCAPDEQVVDDTMPATTSLPSVAPATTTTASVETTAGTATTTPPEPTTTTTALLPLRALALELVAEGFSEPVELASRPGDARIFVVQRDGEVHTVAPDGNVGDQPFADLSDVAHRGSIEQGLLGFAFHPTDPDRVFVYHSRPDNDNQLVEYRVVDDRLDPSSASVLLVIDRESDKIRHNAGHIEFGPDGLLYLSVGDGARASVNGQDPNTLLGALVRIDVDRGDPYAIPPDNPFVSGGGAPEVFVWGLRNPWRFSIDAETATVWIADVGQDDFEEINAAPISDPGRNFGWPIREGPVDFYGGTADTELVEPSLSLDHGETPACSITGGPVYRAAAIPEFDGRLFFADWCFGWVKSAEVSGDRLGDVVDHSAELPLSMVSTFGRDPDGEILIADFATGTIHRIVPVR